MIDLNEFDFSTIAASKVLLQLSGGKDSIACLEKLCEHKIYCEAIHFVHDFSYTIPSAEAKRICDIENVKLHVIDINKEISDLFLSDFRIRPCRFCKGIMDKITANFAEENNFDYICVGDTLDDTMLVNRLNERNEKNLFVARYFNNAVELPDKIFILRPLIRMRSSDIYNYLAKRHVSVKRVGDTGDKYFEYSREGCPLQFKDFGVPYTIELMQKLKVYNSLCSEFAAKKGIRASIHLPSEFIVTIPKGYETSCREFLIANGCLLQEQSRSSLKSQYHYVLHVPISPELTEKSLLDIAIQRILEREGLLKNVSVNLRNGSALSYSFDEGNLTVTLDTEHYFFVAELTSGKRLDVQQLINVLQEIFHRRDIDVWERGHKLNILVFNNNFLGSYGSNQVFFQELCCAIEERGHNLFCAASFEEGEEILRSVNIDFSISFGQYKLQKDGINFYDQFSIPHYQWISDNPRKMNIDEKSPFIRYIFIDDDFIFSLSKLSNRPLCLPLGFRKKSNFRPQADGYKFDAILFPAQIRNIDSIENEIKNSPLEQLIRQFISEFDYDGSYIFQLNQFSQKKFSGMICPKQFFSLTNSYIRTHKRIMVASNIHTKKIFIAGRKPEFEIPNADNFEFLGEVKYDCMEQMMSKFKYVLNVDPNYHSCYHDRFVRCINAGSVCITNENRRISNRTGFSLTYRFSELSRIDAVIQKAEENYAAVWQEQQNFIRGLDWTNSLECVISHWRALQNEPYNKIF